jgi:hypothetical protein
VVVRPGAFLLRLHHKVVYGILSRVLAAWLLNKYDVATIIRRAPAPGTRARAIIPPCVRRRGTVVRAWLRPYGLSTTLMQPSPFFWKVS